MGYDEDDPRPEFLIDGTIEYLDWRGRERECQARVKYTYDGVADPVFISAVAFSDDEEAAYEIERVADDWIADACEDDFADWLQSRDAQTGDAE